MASPPLVLPGVLFVGEDERARIVAHTGPAAGWHVPRGILGWSTEVSVVGRDALTEEIRRSTKMVMPEEQIPPAKNPLTSQAAQKSPLVAVSSKLVPKLVELGVRVHTVGVDRVTSSFYYLAEGGGEDQLRIEGDLVQSVGSMLGERADNAAIERVLDGLPDRLLRALSKGRVSELTMELAALLPRAAADGSGTAEVDLDSFEKDLSQLVGSGEQYAKVAQEIASKLAETNERRIEVPLFGEARKVSQGPFDLSVGEGRVALPTYERWVMSNALGESAGAVAKPSNAPAAAAKSKDSDHPMLANLESGDGAADRAARAAAEAAEAKAAEEKRAAREGLEAKAAAERAARESLEAKAAQERAEAEAKAAADAKAAQERAEEEAKAAAEAKAKAEEEAKAAAEAKAEAEAKAKAEEEARAAAEAKAAEEKAAAEAAAKAAAEAKAAEEKAAAAKKDAKKADAKAADAKRDATKADAKADTKKADAKKADANAKSDAAKDTLKIKRAEKGSSATMYIVIALLLAAVAAWRFYFSKH